MQTITQAQESTTGRSLEELRERLLLLEEERGRLVARDDARLARLIDALDQEYSELYDAIEQLLSGRSCTAVAPPMNSEDPSVTPDWPPHRPVSRWLVSSITTGAVALGLVMLISSRGQASPATETHTPAPVIITAAQVPEDPQSADRALTVPATLPSASVSATSPPNAKQSRTRSSKPRKKTKRRSIDLHASRDPLANL